MNVEEEARRIALTIAKQLVRQWSDEPWISDEIYVQAPDPMPDDHIMSAIESRVESLLAYNIKITIEG